MELTKKELIQKLMNGEKLVDKTFHKPHYYYYDESYGNSFRFLNTETQESSSMFTSWRPYEWEIYKEPSKWWKPKNCDETYYIEKSEDICTTYILGCLAIFKIRRVS